MSNLKITNYVVAFLFSETLDNVWLIEKQKPEWQKGCLNGLGGKIEENESPMDAVIRELNEESGVLLQPSQLFEVGVMSGLNNDNTGFKVHVFTGKTNQYLTTKETEIVKYVPVLDVKKSKHIENVPMLVEASIYKLTGTSNFQYLYMEY